MTLVTLDDYEREAHQRIAAPAWEYIHSGAADEHTLRWNRDAYGDIRLSPRMLRDVTHIDTRVTLVGQELVHPILLAPVAAHTIAHPYGAVGFFASRVAVPNGTYLCVVTFFAG